MTATGSPPLTRRLLWALLVAGLLAVAFAWAVGRQWTGAGRPSLPVISQLSDFALVNRDGSPVGLEDLAGAPWIADLMFTRCTFSCPRMTARMQQLGPGLARIGGGRRVSITLDPDHDTPEVLAAYAESHGVRDPRWLFLSGERDAVRRLAVDDMLLPFDAEAPAGATEAILHSTRFVLIDARGRVRGYYDAFEPGTLERLLTDFAALAREAAG